ncbi:alanine racemase [Zobellia galactanivorans]|nr:MULTISPECIES: alanine racemase [Zobellia]MBU3027954.1 alanine racemase [Zobellia galactanivorans]MDO6808233.1 alanine racemase [Zobellia galactanivorans]OWW27445.1 alanine racemase [Zobellia sp. OII3]
MTKMGETVLEIDLSALEHNYRFLRSRLKDTTKFLGVVKAFAYGSDSVAIAKKLESLGADYLAVAYVKEGIVLREAGIRLPILVLHPLPVSFDRLLAYELEPNIYSVKILADFLQFAQKQGLKRYPIHVKFNTGLNRLGFSEAQVDELAHVLEGRDEVEVVSVLSHLAASEDLNEREFTEQQIASFERIAHALLPRLKRRPVLHLLNTSGIINYDRAQYDMVRSGIGLYGFGNEASIDRQLKPVATLKTVISQIHTIEKGQSIGYNRAYKADENVVTATLPIGHADGIGRQYGNGKAYVTINGHKAPIIGNVCMDMIMVDVSGIDCQEGDEVVVFGERPTAEEFAMGAKTISYEILTGISQRVERKIKN